MLSLCIGLLTDYDSFGFRTIHFVALLDVESFKEGGNVAQRDVYATLT